MKNSIKIVNNILNLDLQTEKNIIDLEFISTLSDIVEIVKKNNIKHIVFLNSNSSVFGNGVDVNLIDNLTSERLENLIKEITRLFNQLRSSDIVLIAYVQGRCIGGHFELALMCDYIFVDSLLPIFGLPEIKLGLLPAFQGYRHLINRIGLFKSFQFIIGKSIPAHKCLTYGIISSIISKERFFDKNFIHSLNKNKHMNKKHSYVLFLKPFLLFYKTVKYPPLKIVLENLYDIYFSNKQDDLILIKKCHQSLYSKAMRFLFINKKHMCNERGDVGLELISLLKKKEIVNECIVEITCILHAYIKTIKEMTNNYNKINKFMKKNHFFYRGKRYSRLLKDNYTYLRIKISSSENNKLKKEEISSNQFLVLFRQLFIQNLSACVVKNTVTSSQVNFICAYFQFFPIVHGLLLDEKDNNK